MYRYRTFVPLYRFVPLEISQCPIVTGRLMKRLRVHDTSCRQRGAHEYSLAGALYDRQSLHAWRAPR